jgi:hypothetical protein
MSEGPTHSLLHGNESHPYNAHKLGHVNPTEVTHVNWYQTEATDQLRMLLKSHYDLK